MDANGPNKKFSTLVVGRKFGEGLRFTDAEGNLIGDIFISRKHTAPWNTNQVSLALRFPRDIRIERVAPKEDDKI